MPPIPLANPSATASSATLAAQSLPPLPRISRDASTLARIAHPVKRINTDADTQNWIHSCAHTIYSLFVQRIAEACVGKPTRPLPSLASSTATVSGDGPSQKLVRLLLQLDIWTQEIEPQSKPQRFGNLAFRDWGARLEEQVDELHRHLLPSHLHPFIRELSSYLLDSFGSFVRIDYGSGHEFCFAAWLCFLYRINFFDDDDGKGAASPTQPSTEVEERLGLEIFPLYLHVVWRLQDRYSLEPAGSHGVWGLDDYQFLPYVLGAAQLRSQSKLRPAQLVQASSSTTLLSSLPDQTPATLVQHPVRIPASLLSGSKDTLPPLPNLYLTSLLRIQVLKKGPFHEHSPLLHDISTSVPNFIKTYTGMVKMYEAECINKRVVVQHFKFGGVGWVWSPSNDEAGGGDGMVATPMPTMSGGGVGQTNSMALGFERGNASSMGVPTTRMTAHRPQPVSGPITGLGRGRTPSTLVPSATRAPVATSTSSFSFGSTTPFPTRTTTSSSNSRSTTMAPPPQPGARPGQQTSKTMTISGIAAVPTRTGVPGSGPTPAPRTTAGEGEEGTQRAAEPTSASKVEPTSSSRPTPTSRPAS